MRRIHLSEERFHREKLLRDSFDVVDAVDTEHQRDALKLPPQLCDACLDPWRLEATTKPARVDANGEGVNLERVLHDSTA